MPAVQHDYGKFTSQIPSIKVVERKGRAMKTDETAPDRMVIDHNHMTGGGVRIDA